MALVEITWEQLRDAIRQRPDAQRRELRDEIERVPSTGVAPAAAPKPHTLLDIPPVRLGAVLRPLTSDDDLLGRRNGQALCPPLEPATASSSDLDAPPTETLPAASSSAKATDGTGIGGSSHPRQGESGRYRRQAGVKLGGPRRVHSIANHRRTAPMACGRKSRDDRPRARCNPQIQLPSENPPAMPSRAGSQKSANPGILEHGGPLVGLSGSHLVGKTVGAGGSSDHRQSQWTRDWSVTPPPG